ncbi:MAG: TrmH family RNA methyltransferase [Treponemataceae bacterium]
MKNKQKKELAVCGFAAVKALEKKHLHVIRRFYFSFERAVQFRDLCKKLAAQRVPYNQVDSKDLEKLCGSVHHQGVVAMIEEPQIPELNSKITLQWLHEKECAVLMDRVGNANNLGAIARSAAFFGIKNIIIPKDEAQSSITTSTYRVAQGGMESVNVFTVDSSASFLALMKDKMIRFGTDVKSKTPVGKMKEIIKNANGKSFVIVLGNEESGISREVKENCDYLVSIPRGENIDGLDSLNVAQAASVIFYALKN